MGCVNFHRHAINCLPSAAAPWGMADMAIMHFGHFFAVLFSLLFRLQRQQNL